MAFYSEYQNLREITVILKDYTNIIAENYFTKIN